MFDESSGALATSTYFTKIMTEDDVLFLKFLVSHYDRAPSKARRYLQRNCRDVQSLEIFLKENSHLFFVENRKVALYNDQLDLARNNAAKYFEEKLSEYENPIDFMSLKTRHIDEASDDVISFIARFYPGREFKSFLKSRLDKFFVDKDDTVFLIEIETVSFFERMLELFGKKGQHFLKVRGHIGQAEPHIQMYVNNFYPGQDFQYFLQNNNDVFKMDKNGNVTLVEENSSEDQLA